MSTTLMPPPAERPGGLSRRAVLGAALAVTGVAIAGCTPLGAAPQNTTSTSPRNSRPWSMAPLSAIALHPIDLIRAASSAGCESVGFRFAPLTETEPSYPYFTDASFVRSIASALDDHGVLGWDTEVIQLGPNRTVEEYRPWLDVAAELGLQSLLVQADDPDVNRAADKTAQMAAAAREYGMRCDLEFTSWSATPDLQAAWNIVEAADQENLGILVDVLHFTRSNSSLQLIREIPAEKFAVAHLNDVSPTPASDTAARIAEARGNRLVPGDGVADISGILAALPSNITLSIELPNTGDQTSRGNFGHVDNAYSRSVDYIDSRVPTAIS